MIFSFLQKKQKTKKGFTLIEALVSLGLFSMVVVSASGVILSVISSNKKNQAVSSVVNNLSYSIESMVRDIKTGYDYRCYDEPDDIAALTSLDHYKLSSDNCPAEERSNITLVSTITGKEQIVRYELVESDVESGLDKYIKKTLYTEDNLTGGVQSLAAISYPLTDATNISIDNLGFSVSTPLPVVGTPVGSEEVGQPGVFLILKGKAKINKINISDFFIQTYISQRLPNLI